jgi:hydrogenase expression/formation protein HypC
MCMGVPMRIIETGSGFALCEGMGQRREIDTMLVGDPPVGTWLLTFLNSAREIITPADAARISDALHAVNLVMQGETDVGHLFADLIDNEPRRPLSNTKVANTNVANKAVSATNTGDRK